MKRTGVAIAVLVAAALIIAAIARSGDHKQPAQKPATQQQSNPCPDTKPCIQLTAEDGTKYKLNDFRFLPDHCIAILSLPDNTSKKICGNYKLDWIGPNTTKGIRGQSI